MHKPQKGERTLSWDCPVVQTLFSDELQNILHLLYAKRVEKALNHSCVVAWSFIPFYWHIKEKKVLSQNCLETWFCPDTGYMLFKRDFCLKYISFCFCWSIQILLLHPDEREKSRVSLYWCCCEPNRTSEERIHFLDNHWIHFEKHFNFGLFSVFKFLSISLFTFRIHKDRIRIFWLVRGN